MAFLDKLGDIARNIGDKATDVIETTKLNNKINAEKTAITECMRQIGDYYYKKYQDGEPGDAGVAELFVAIESHNKTIAETREEIAKIENESKAKEQAAAAPAVVVAEGIACQSCGKSNAAGTKFCSGCGTALSVSAEPSMRACPKCGAQSSSDKSFCGACGYKFE